MRYALLKLQILVRAAKQKMRYASWCFSPQTCSCSGPLLVLVLGAALVVPGSHSHADETVAQESLDFFENRIRPLLSDRCYECHGPDRQESDLRVDNLDSLLEGGASGQPAIDRELPEQSLLLQAVRNEGDYAMPPDEPLTDQEIALLEQWVAAGAVWPESTDVSLVTSMQGRMTQARRDHWSLQAIERPTIEASEQDRWSRTHVDRIVWKGLESQDLTPSAEADRRTLIRRLKFDLLGLPGDPQEVDQFISDSRPDAYERLVDRLLASPRYGERWGRHWLDVARYGDTRGYAFARDRRYPFAYTYRDYVIESFNLDKPYDRFVIEQLAADKLDLDEDQRGALAGLGFLTTGRRFNNRHDDIDDQIDAVTRGFMGLTVACARCHDHKYDPIPTEDYYSLYGVFASTTEPGELPILGRPDEVASYQTYLDGLNERRGALDGFKREKREEIIEHARTHITDYLVRVLSEEPEELLSELPFISLHAEELKPPLLDRWRNYIRPRRTLENPVFGIWTRLAEVPPAEFADRAAALAEEIKSGEVSGYNEHLLEPFLEHTPVNIEGLASIYGVALEETHRLWKEQGANDEALKRLPISRQQLGIILYDDRSPTNVPMDQLATYLIREDHGRLNELQSAFDTYQADSPDALPRAMAVTDRPNLVNPVVFIRGQAARRGDPVPRQNLELISHDQRTPFRQGSGRLELAQQIVAPENPLTARVIVNRVWMHHFGEPLVAQPSDFGLRSDTPQQVELLDYLASFLIENDWSIKALHREILLSSVYRQQSIDRPDCRELDPDNDWLWRMNPRRLEFEPLRDSILFVAGELDLKMYGKASEIVGETPSHRRAIYGTVDRQDLPNLFRAFDFASPDQSAARRPKTTIPQQALFLMNSEFVIGRARELARSLAYDPADPGRSIRQLYRRALNRLPDQQESNLALRFLQTSDEIEEPTSLSRWEQLAHLVLLTNEFAYVD